MGGGQAKPGIHVQLDKNYYLPGDLVLGNVFIHAQQPYPASKIVLHILGMERTWWKYSPKAQINIGQPLESSTSNHSMASMIPKGVKRSVPIPGDRVGECKIIQASFTMSSWGHAKSKKMQGQFAYPFQFRLPNYIPGSFVQENDDYKASVIYQIRCRILCEGKAQDVNFSQELIIREPRRNKEEVLYGQIYLYPQTCCCTKNGVSKVSCYFQKNQYVSGEECFAICEADNYKCNLKIKQIKVKFKKNLTLVSNFGEQRTFEQQINRTSFPGVAPHGKYCGEEAKKVSLPLMYRNSKIPAPPSTSGRLVKCQYYLQVSPDLSGWYVKNVGSFEVGLNIIHEAQTAVLVEQPQNWNPQVNRKSQIMLGQDTSNVLLNQMGNSQYAY